MGLFSFLSKNKQGSAADEDFDEPVKPRRTRRTQAADSQDPVDPVLPEKKRARRRLIGASALVLAAIIGLPMIFDSEPKPLADDIAIQIPSRDKLPSNATTTQQVALPLPPETQAAPEAVKAPETATTSIKQDVKPAPKPEPKAEPKSELKPPTAIPAAAKEKSQRFILQVAAIATKEHANELQARLKKAGIKSYSQKVSTKAGERIRIRVGPFNTKDEAMKMRARLVKLGLTGTLQPA